MHQETLLIIDDEFSIRETFSFFFQDEGYKVFTAENGKTGLKTFFREKIDIVITDLKMPEKNGIEVMNDIHTKSPDTPMIVVSGAGQQEDIINALRMGARDYITKPIEDLEMVNHVIRKALENKYLLEENQRYRKQLEKNAARYRTITENIAEGVFTVDANENLTFTNQAFCNMLGYSMEALSTINLQNLSTHDSFKTIEQQTLIRATGITSRYEIQMITRGKTLVHVELACSPLFDDNNRYNGAIAVARDITKRIELRKQYQKFIREQKDKSRDMIAICASCKSIRGRDSHWVQVEDFFSDLVFSHGICPDCCEKLYPDFDFSELDEEKD
ncbi:MAG: histidine kinase [Desulfobacteraceae bacterium 4572_89]|nr:MAG: histidine kinase [Desulfobacteraceae bacterium 4572_89]